MMLCYDAKWSRMAFLCQWNGGSTNWVALQEMENAYLLQVADYARANRTDDGPVFAW
jgi:hypothetical protein